MASGKTTYKELPFPKTTDPDTICADWESLTNRIDTLPEGNGSRLQSGVSETTDWNFTATINSGTGELGSEAATGGIAWMNHPVIERELIESRTPNIKLSELIPPLPGSGKYMAIGFELAPTTLGGAAIVSVKSGAEKGTQSEAEAASPEITAGKIRVRDIIVKNTAGVYSIVKQIDRRPWARGFVYATPTNEFVELITGKERREGLSPVRLECSGAPILITLSCKAETLSTEPIRAVAQVTIDGLLTFIEGYGEFAHYKAVVANPVTNCSASGIYLLSTGSFTAGSHLFALNVSKEPSSGAVQFTYGVAYRELVGVSANNGTA